MDAPRPFNLSSGAAKIGLAIVLYALSAAIVLLTLKESNLDGHRPESLSGAGDANPALAARKARRDGPDREEVRRLAERLMQEQAVHRATIAELRTRIASLTAVIGAGEAGPGQIGPLEPPVARETGHAQEQSAQREPGHVQGPPVEPPEGSQQKIRAPSQHQPRDRMTALAVLEDAFHPGPLTLAPGTAAVLRSVAEKVQRHPDHRVVIEGHSDSVPVSPSAAKRYRDNLELSRLRARSVASRLIEYGVASRRITVVGLGDTQPIASNRTAAGRARNRRVEIKLIAPVPER